MNAHGRRFVRGKALEDDLRSVIVDTILNEGGDVATDEDTKRPASVYYSLFERTKIAGKNFFFC